MDKVRIIRLQSGEDIMASYHENEGTGEVYLGAPMTMFFKRLPSGKAMMMMSPWLPLELIEYNHTYIFVSDILTIIEPKKVLVEYYRKIVKETEEDALQDSKTIEESLSGEASDYQIPEELNEEGMLEDMDMESFTGISKKHILH
jgi:hypothetical protein